MIIFYSVAIISFLISFVSLIIVLINNEDKKYDTDILEIKYKQYEKEQQKMWQTLLDYLKVEAHYTPAKTTLVKISKK